MKNNINLTVLSTVDQQSVSDEGRAAIQRILYLRAEFCRAIEQLEQTLDINIQLDADPWLQAVIDSDFCDWPDGVAVDQQTAIEFVAKLTGWRPLDYRSDKVLEAACVKLLDEME